MHGAFALIPKISTFYEAIMFDGLVIMFTDEVDFSWDFMILQFMI